MRIRIGFVSQSWSLWEASPARALTYTRYKQMSVDERVEKLHSVTKENLQNTLRTIYFCIAHGIQVFRFSSSIVPLATHPEVKWDFVKPFEHEFKEIGQLVKRYGIRSSFHPNQFTLFTSDKPHISENAVMDMAYHYDMLQAMGLEKEGTINIHVGGAYGNKELAIERFRENIKLLPENIKQRMTLENDDKTYTTEETLILCEELGVPLAFDYHHEFANPSSISYEELLPRVFATWNDIGIIPKIHISSPLSEKKLRHHADYVDVQFIMEFIKVVMKLGQDVDFMVEAKYKDEAALQLVEDIAKIRGVKRLSGGMVEL
ncbi:UV DNA damage repair endonuclease UvsE [Sutcliffiella rhizosphaerae]|uniref:UV DNA damage endonuclease n=1 Tax=Sutcliffiella rhizosphaerae TaxID=2880967 RepID=A0ABM8YJL5_9BACI|nr:UV DNA damage repair endonuclease UvsE [Sutcliffiella rhizosphaerae]CAG9620094.1 UV DNA damage endonuclease [Sutcliffiella rhizosphaerae]